MKTFLRILLLVALFVNYGCEKPKSEEKAPTYTIVNNGSGGVTSISDTEDSSSPEVVQAVPSVSNEAYPQNIPIMFFLNDKIYLNSLKDNFIVTVNGKIVGGTISVNTASNGFAILIFTPSTAFGSGKEITVTLKTGIQDDGGNPFLSEFSIMFTTSASSGTNFDSNKSFESGTSGVTFIGDGAIMTGTNGAISPSDGSKFCAITSGNQLISPNNSIGNTSSMAILGPIGSNISNLTFNYDFVSAEFNDYVGSIYDDCAMITVTGPHGSFSQMITSVNLTGSSTTTSCLNFAGLPDAGDDYAGHTGWKNSSFSFSGVGSPAFIIFTVTDVSDNIFSSALIIDKVSY